MQWLGFVAGMLLGSGATRAESADVVVCGGTASGVLAAVAAAREGASVILLEPTQHLGGMVSGGLGWTDYGRPETVGGYTREYYERIGKHYAKTGVEWHVEPHVAEAVFNEMASKAHVRVEYGQRLKEHAGVQLDGRRIAAIRCESGREYRAPTFIDATYEGDLMAQAGVSFHAGRESKDEFGEPGAGVRRLIPSGKPGAGKDKQGVLPLVYDGDPGAPSSGDNRIQSYNFRLCLTRTLTNRVPIAKPAAYDARDYTLSAQLLAAMPSPTLDQVLTLSPLANGKTDVNNYGHVSTDLPNASWGYPNGTYAQRQRLWQRHKDYVQGLLWFLANEPRVPEAIRQQAAPWGLAKDEFTDTENWPRQLYVREARRMMGSYVMTEQDTRSEREKPDAIAMGSYMLDCHPVQRVLAKDDDYYTEGYIGGANRVFPYEIPYRSLTPRREQCANLLVSVCLSASHVAWSSLRMEPVFMMTGHAAGLAAAVASKQHLAVQDVPMEPLRNKLLEQQQVLRWKIPGAMDPAMMPGVVVDEDRAEMTGVWKMSNAANQLVGVLYRYVPRDAPPHAARYVADLPSAGRYEVHLFYPPAANRASNVKVIIHHAGGEDAVFVNQRQDPTPLGRSLGIFEFSKGKAGWVQIGNDGADGVVAIDAVQWLPARP